MCLAACPSLVTMAARLLYILGSKACRILDSGVRPSVSRTKPDRGPLISALATSAGQVEATVGLGLGGSEQLHVTQQRASSLIGPLAHLLFKAVPIGDRSKHLSAGTQECKKRSLSVWLHCLSTVMVQEHSRLCT